MRVRQPRFARTIAAALLLIALTLLVGCESSDPQNTLAPKGDVGQDIKDLFVPIAWIAIVIFVLVFGAIIYMVIRFRRKDGPLPKQTHGNTRLEIAWTIAPTLLMAAIAVPTLATLFDLSDTPDGALEVKVTASQWWWAFEYPSEGVLTANEMHIPVGRPVKVILQSNDVIHSFWVPKLAGKTDVVPNSTNTMWFNATEPGEYLGQCVEFCGLSHAIMRFRVIAEPEDQFRAWVASQKQPASPPAGALAQSGATKFANTCAVCHTVTGADAKGKVGPNLTHFASRDCFAGCTLRRTGPNIERWLRDPAAVKPGSFMPNYHLKPDEIEALVAYLESLK